MRLCSVESGHLERNVPPITFRLPHGLQRSRNSLAACCAATPFGLIQNPRCEPSSIQNRSAFGMCS